MTVQINIIKIRLDLIIKLDTYLLYVLKWTSVQLKSTCNNSVLLCTKLLSKDLNNCVQASTWPFNNVKKMIPASIPPTSSKISRN